MEGFPTQPITPPNESADNKKTEAEIAGTVDEVEILVDPDAQENFLVDREKAIESLHENFGHIISEQELEQAVAGKLAPALRQNLKFPTDSIPVMEEAYGRYEAGEYGIFEPGTDESLFFSRYSNLRETGLSQAEIERLIQVNAENPEALNETLLEAVKNEYEVIDSQLQNPDIQQNIIAAFSSLRKLYSDAEVMPSRTGLPVTQFIGKYQGMILQMLEGSSSPGIRLGQATYYPGRDACVVEVPNQIRLGDVANAVHENFHSLSANEVCAQDGKNTEFDNTSAKTIKSGFFTMNAGNERRPHALTGLNEGTTELLARITCAKGGVEYNKTNSYENYVKNVLVLNQVLENQPINSSQPYEDIDPKTISNLLTRYGSRTGTLSLARDMKEKIGPKALIIFDILSSTNSDFETFVNALQEFKEGKEPTQTIEMTSEELAAYGVSLEEIQKHYPFIREKVPSKVNFDV